MKTIKINFLEERQLKHALSDLLYNNLPSRATTEEEQELYRSNTENVLDICEALEFDDLRKEYDQNYDESW
ncbi:hypothetical protein GTO87_03540 [Ligilactobacillus saerimneri]|uniref:Uncharacterized protein n=1 Tax=Ligilactobacillus saerimneri TaxID=228229 RepID=A0A7H9EJ74_9LACO|nr:hypothetical protein [Ligilactobacillus saerimneri]QLL77753.1 hypothetical protein GTO87_03540 [Ligilactobacillus saerimneri]